MRAKQWCRIGLAVLLGWCATGLVDPEVGLASSWSTIVTSEPVPADSPVLSAKKKKKKKTAQGNPSPTGAQQSQPSGEFTDIVAPMAAAARSPGDPFLVPIASGLSSPLLVTHAGDGSNRLFVVEKGGLIKVIKNGQVLPTPFLDLRSEVTPPSSTSGERGLLALAFHPNFASTGVLFVYYTDNDTGPGNEAGANTLRRYTVSNPSSDVATVTSNAILIAQPDRASNHNGGMLVFDRNPTPSNRLLYLSIGDEGGGGDPFENAQNLSSLFGKILRIDVNNKDSGLEYKIPPSNPFFNTPNARGEIWAYGYRNPWRMSFDRSTGDMYVGDVGQGLWEEIDFQPSSSTGGENYGWDDMEGAHCYEPSTGCLTNQRELPVLEYGHGADGCSVTGGYVYRGTRYPSLAGSYFFSDFCSGIIWRTQKPASGPWSRSVFITSGENVSSFGEDEAGEVYIVSLGGSIFRIADPGCSPRPNVQVTAAPGAPGNLIATVVGGTNASTPDNHLFSIQFTQLDNGIVDIAGSNNHATPFTHNFATSVPQSTFTVRRPTNPPPPPGAATTVHFVVTDACGSWPSFVGGGAGSF